MDGPIWRYVTGSPELKSIVRRDRLVEFLRSGYRSRRIDGSFGQLACLRMMYFGQKCLVGGKTVPFFEPFALFREEWEAPVQDGQVRRDAKQLAARYRGARDISASIFYCQRRPDLYGPDRLEPYRRAAVTSIASSKARSPPSCRCNSRQNISLSSISRLPVRLASPCRRCCWHWPTRLLSEGF